MIYVDVTYWIRDSMRLLLFNGDNFITNETLDKYPLSVISLYSRLCFFSKVDAVFRNLI